MQKEVTKLSEAEIIKFYPIKDESLGWYFRTDEASNGVWFVEGSDQWDRKVSAQGADPEQLLTELVLEASVLNEHIKNT